MFTFEKIQSILDGDMAKVKKQLLYAGLLLLIFESFKKRIVYKVDYFFGGELKLVDGMFSIVKKSKEFIEYIKQNGEGEKEHHNNLSFRSALKWFKDLGAICQKEFDEFERIYLIRNNIAHELINIIVDDNLQYIKQQDIEFIITIYTKIEFWWFKEIEVTTNPMLAYKDSQNFEQFETCEIFLLKLVLTKIL